MAPEIPRARRPATARAEEDGVNAVRTIINRMNCQFVTTVPDNAAIDGHLQLVNRSGEFEGYLLGVQVKAGRSYIASENDVELRVRVQRRHVDLWTSMQVPVLLFYYDGRTQRTYWLAVRNYLEAYPQVMGTGAESVVFAFHKNDDLFSEDSYDQLYLVVRGEFKYGRPYLSSARAEVLYSNWLRVTGLLDTVYKIPARLATKQELPPEITDSLALIVKEGSLFLFSQPREELEFMQDISDLRALRSITTNGLPSAYLAELLNATVRVLAKSRGLVELRRNSLRFAFPREVLQTPATNTHRFESLGGKRTRRVLVYEIRKGRNTEYRHHACVINFIREGGNWYLELDPYMHISFSRYVPAEELRARRISERQNTYNSQYLYMLHFWKQYLSGSTGIIEVITDRWPGAPAISVSTQNDYVSSDFSLLDDRLVADE